MGDAGSIIALSANVRHVDNLNDFAQAPSSGGVNDEDTGDGRRGVYWVIGHAHGPRAQHGSR